MYVFFRIVKINHHITKVNSVYFGPLKFECLHNTGVVLRQGQSNVIGGKLHQASFFDIYYFRQHLTKIWKSVYFPISLNSDPKFIIIIIITYLLQAAESFLRS